MALSVHSFHINIDVGDSAIHLLVDGSTPPQIHRAVLIDGGKNFPYVLERIKACIEWIQNPSNYKIVPGVPSEDPPLLRFDSVVVTHWDLDHLGGILKLIKDGCKEGPASLTENDELKKIVASDTPDTEKVKALEQDISGFQCRYFKYAVVQPTPIFPAAASPRKRPPIRNRSELLTTFYCPYLFEPQKNQYNTDAKSTKMTLDGSCVAPKNTKTDYSKSSEIINMKGPFFVQNQSGMFTRGTRTNTLGARICFDYKVPTVNTARGKLFRLFDLCKLSCEFDEYLGAELFSGTLLADSAIHPRLTDPSLLIKNVGLKPTDGPRMYIIAGDQTIIGATPLAQYAVLPSLTTARFMKPIGGIVRTVDDHHPNLGTRQTSARFESKPMNSPSIVCVILGSLVDPTTIPDTGNPKAWKLWHYLAGDALWDVEGGVANWLKKGDDPTTVFMKISHHGGADSTPVALLDTLSPLYVIAPAPERTTFGHPRPEILLYLDALDRSRTNRQRMEVYTLNWPDWIGTSDLAKTRDFSMANFDAIDDGVPNPNNPAHVFLTQLLSLYAKIDGRSILDIYWKDKAIHFTVPIPKVPKKNPKPEVKAAAEAAKQQRILAINVLFSDFWTEKLCLQEENTTNGQQVAWLIAKTGDVPTVEVASQSTKVPTKLSRKAALVEDPPPLLPELPGPEGDDKPELDRTASAKRKMENDAADDDVELKAARTADNNADTMEEDIDVELIVDVIDDDEEGDYLPGVTYVIDTDEEEDAGLPPADITPPQDLISHGNERLLSETKSEASIVLEVEPKSVGSQLEKLSSFESKRDKIEAISVSVIPRDTPALTVLPTRLAATEAAAANSAVLQAASPAPFYLCGADYQPFTPGASQALLSAGVFSDFIAGFYNGYIAVGSAPAPGPQNGPSTVHPADEWMQRLIRNGIGIQEVDLVGQMGAQSAQITEVRATVKFLGQTLSFSSNSSRLVSFPPPASTATPQLTDAFLPKYNIMGLGLEANNTSFAITDILSVFGMPWLKGANTIFSLPGFDSIGSLKATLDSTAGSRSSLSFKGDNVYTTWLRLKFVIGDLSFPTTFKEKFPFLQDFTLNEACLVGLNKGTCTQGAKAGTLSSQIGFETTITINTASPLSIQAFIIFGYDSTTFKIRFVGKSAEDNVSQVIDWMAQVVGLAASDKDQLDPKTLLSNTDTSKITLGVQQISLTLSNPGSGKSFSVLAASINFEVGVYGSLFNVGLSWPPSTLKADLWTDIPADLDTYALVPYIETYNYFTPVNTPPGAVGLGQLGNTGSIPLPPDPLGLNLTISKLSFLASRDSMGNITLQFHGVIGSKKPTGTAPIPKLILGDLDLFLSYKTQTGYEIDLSTSIYLIPRNFPDEGAATVAVSVGFTESNGVKNWEVIATGNNLKFSTLYYLFDSDSNDAVMDMLENFSIPEIEVRWDYSGGEANLYVTGALTIGPFELDLLYNYDNGGGPGKSFWTFEASLGTNQSDGYKLVDLLADLGADADVTNAIAEVPFVNKIQIPAATPTNGQDPPVKVHVSKESGGVHIFWVQIAITSDEGTLSFTFVQYQAARIVNQDGQGTTAPKGYKRIIRVMLDKLPSIPSIPVVGQIDQPVDSIDYLWIGDSTIDSTTGVPAGLTATEIGLINGTMVGDNKIPFKATKSDLQSNSPGNTGAANKDPYVLLAGHHFIIVAEKVVILDYIFGGKKTTPPASGQPDLKAVLPPKSATSPVDEKGLTLVPLANPPTKNVLRAAVPVENATQADSGATKGAVKKSLGPLTIQSVGLQTKDGYLYLLIDATVALGPITLTIIGFGVGLPLSDFNLNELKHLNPAILGDFKVVISGMSVDFDAPPVLIAGVFIKEVTTDYEAYKGGLAVSILPYALMAVGAYQRTFSNDMKSVFVFARLDGPLFTLEFAEISGVEVGFGYNYNLRSPQAADILQFPLVQGVTATDNPMDALTNFGTYLSVQQDSVWFAIGMKVDAFQILSVDAAAIVQFSATSLKIAIVGIASASMPPDLKNRNEMFLYVELGIVASIDILGGSITCQAQLTPNSFVLYPDCHLTGGFALCYWFGESPYAGDWVFTVGGYHPAFKPPTYYPVVPRVGINWNLSDCLTITGGAFFAVTPQMCMGGGNLDAIFAAGPVHAEFKAWASFLINFKPFYFIADIGVSVSVGFHIDVWIIHINIQVDISATLHLQGPPFGGVVHVDLWIHNFDIYFGDQNNVPDPLKWDPFLELVRQTRPAEAASLDASSSALIVIALVEGSVPEKIATANGKTGAKWFVRAGSLKFRIECKIPLDDMLFGDGTNSQSWVTLEKTDPNAPKLEPNYARPMQVMKALTSLLTVTITPPAAAGAQDPKTPVVDDENPFRVTPTLRNLPNAIWDQYSQGTDPTANGGNNNIGALLTPASSPSASTTQRLSGFTFISPIPRLPTELNFPPFNATDSMSEGVFQDGTDNPTKSNNPLLPPNPSMIDDRPTLPQTPPVQNADLPAPRVADPFTEVVNNWVAADEVAAQALADVWTTVLGWGKVIPGTTNVAALTAFESLDASKPEMLMANLPSFENWYAGCPFITAVA